MKKSTFLWTAMLFVMFGSVAFALSQDPTPAAAATVGDTSGNVPSVVKGILNGLLAGVVAAGMGWLKNRDAKTGSQEGFEVKHAVPTLIVGAVVGAWAGWQNKDLSTFTAWVQTTPFVIVAEMIWKIIWRQSTPVVREALATIKSGASNPPTPPPPTP